MYVGVCGCVLFKFIEPYYGVCDCMCVLGGGSSLLNHMVVYVCVCVYECVCVCVCLCRGMSGILNHMRVYVSVCGCMCGAVQCTEPYVDVCGRMWVYVCGGSAY